MRQKTVNVSVHVCWFGFISAYFTPVLPFSSLQSLWGILSQRGTEQAPGNAADWKVPPQYSGEECQSTTLCVPVRNHKTYGKRNRHSKRRAEDRVDIKRRCNEANDREGAGGQNGVTLTKNFNSFPKPLTEVNININVYTVCKRNHLNPILTSVRAAEILLFFVHLTFD